MGGERDGLGTAPRCSPDLPRQSDQLPVVLSQGVLSRVVLNRGAGPRPPLRSSPVPWGVPPPRNRRHSQRHSHGPYLRHRNSRAPSADPRRPLNRSPSSPGLAHVLLPGEAWEACCDRAPVRNRGVNRAGNRDCPSAPPRNSRCRNSPGWDNRVLSRNRNRNLNRSRRFRRDPRRGGSRGGWVRRLGLFPHRGRGARLVARVEANRGCRNSLGV